MTRPIPQLSAAAGDTVDALNLDNLSRKSCNVRKYIIPDISCICQFGLQVVVKK
jgi:hypothetical protein